MPVATFPAEITRHLRLDSLTESPPDLTLRTSVDAGPAKLRRRQTAGIRPIGGSIDLTRDQVAVLDAFYVITLASGSLPFDWRHPRTGQPARFRFAGVPAYRPQAPRGDGTEWWRAELRLEIIPGAAGAPSTPSNSITVTGPDGTSSFGIESTLSVELYAACLGDGNAIENQNKAIATFGSMVAAGGGVRWSYTDGGATSTITYAAAGWSYDIAPEHLPFTPCAGTGAHIAPATGSQASTPAFVRNATRPIIVNGGGGDADPAALCGGDDPTWWFNTLVVSLNNGGLEMPPLGAQGFRAYAGLCPVEP